MTSNYISPVILEKFNSRQILRHHRQIHQRKLSQLGRSIVLPIDGADKRLSVGRRLITGEIAVVDEKESNAVLLRAENQPKVGYPAGSPMIARKGQTFMDDVERHIDVKFFSELVKPMQYRWKFQKDKLKTILPSKHGFHQRSNSPTFQRLVMATEMLQKYLTDNEVNHVKKTFEEDFFETQSNEWPTLTVKQSVVHSLISDEISSTQASYTGSMPKHNTLKLQEKSAELSKQDFPHLFNERDVDEDGDWASNSATSKLLTPTTSLAVSQSVVTKTSQQEFKVDFRKLESHSELHLFLPHIHDSSSWGETPVNSSRKVKLTNPLPQIEDSVNGKKTVEEKLKSKRRQKGETKTKKKPFTRVENKHDEHDVKDTLNDVPTLISLGNDKNLHAVSMGMFENSAQQLHRKSTGIKQP